MTNELKAMDDEWNKIINPKNMIILSVSQDDFDKMKEKSKRISHIMHYIFIDDDNFSESLVDMKNSLIEISEILEMIVKSKIE